MRERLLCFVSVLAFAVQAGAPVLGKGVFRLDRGFTRRSCVEVKGKVAQLPEDGSAKEWGGGMTKQTLHVGGVMKKGFFSHPPYLKGAGFLWSDFPLVLPDVLVSDGGGHLFALHAHNDPTFTFVPSSKGSFEAARRFRAVAGYRKSPGRDRLGARMCLDQWGGDYARAAAGLAKEAGKCKDRK